MKTSTGITLTDNLWLSQKLSVIGLYKAVHLVSYSTYSTHVLTVDNQCCRSEPFDLNTVEC